MQIDLDKSWHLAETNDEIQITEFELLLWRAFHSFTRWQEDCQNCVSEYGLYVIDIVVLHSIRMKDRPKTLYEISRLMNRDDTPNIQYSIKKLIKLGLIEKAKVSSKKAISYQATSLGIEETDSFQNTRRKVFIQMLKDIPEIKLKEATQVLALLKGIYDEAGRIAASYKA